MKESRRKNIHHFRGIHFFLRRISRYGKIIIFILAASSVAVVLYAVLIRSSYFKINEVRINGTKSFVNSSDLNEIVKGQVFGRSIFTVRSGRIRKTLLENFQGAKDIKVYKLYPKTISVEVFERVPLAVVYSTPSEYYLIDEAGYVLGLVEPEKTNLPRVHYDGDIQVGFFLNNETVPVYLELMDAINTEKLNVSGISFNPAYVRLYLPGGTEILMKNDADKFETIRLLNVMMRQFTLEGKKVSKIDLRFKEVIVSYE